MVLLNVLLISGSKDDLFPASQQDEMIPALTGAASVTTEILPADHDTIYKDKRHALTVLGWLEKMRQKEATEAGAPADA